MHYSLPGCELTGFAKSGCVAPLVEADRIKLRFFDGKYLSGATSTFDVTKMHAADPLGMVELARRLDLLLNEASQTGRSCLRSQLCSMLGASQVVEGD